MSYSALYLAQVELLLKILPVINQQECFALKGGTAINLFIRDMPRLSVDIDLTYLPIEPREIFLEHIVRELKTLAKNIRDGSNNEYQVVETLSQQAPTLRKLSVMGKRAQIIIEPNLVLRGCVFDCEIHSLCKLAQSKFLNVFKIKTLSHADLYGGKICAALARNHPRDFFDVKFLLENEGLTEQIRQAMIIYIASSSRPMHELLNPEPNLQDMRALFENSFIGMTDLDISYEQLLETRYLLIKKILEDLTLNEREFLLSVKLGTPEWNLLPVHGIDKLPGLEWKVMNIKKMDLQKHQDALNKLKNVLGL